MITFIFQNLYNQYHLILAFMNFITSTNHWHWHIYKNIIILKDRHGLLIVRSNIHQAKWRNNKWLIIITEITTNLCVCVCVVCKAEITTDVCVWCVKLKLQQIYVCISVNSQSFQKHNWQHIWMKHTFLFFVPHAWSKKGKDQTGNLL